MLKLTTPSDLSDEELLKALQADGSEMVFRELFNRYYTPLVTFASRILSASDDPYELATDVVQNMFVSLYEHPVAEVSSSVRTLLFSSVKNACLNVIKHQKVVRKYEEEAASSFSDEAADSDSAESLIEQSEADAKVASALAKLPEQCRKIFIMSRFDGATNQQIADMLDISKRTVETQISNALRTLRKLLLTVILFFSLT
ncbi:MAG: RNA polymerase sigma-70 factor [Marinilabiliaceae bacterium]